MLGTWITTTISFDSTGKVLFKKGYEWLGPIAFAKGDQTANAAEQSQAAFDTQLQGMMKSQYGNSQQIYGFLKNILEPQIAKGGEGYTPEQLTAMRTGATDQISSGYNNAQAALQNRENQQNGGSDLPSGVNSQLSASLLSNEAQAQAGAQNDITTQNANLQQTNYWNSINALAGQQASLNPLGYANSATSGSGAVSNLSQAVTASSGPTFGSILGGVLGAAAGGASSALTGHFAGCWIAARVFGENFYTGIKTNKVRNYLWKTWTHAHWYAPHVLRLYTIMGEWVSRQPYLVGLLAPLFHAALRKAEQTNV